MLFSYGKDVNFPDISAGNNTINETSVTKCLGIHSYKILNFLNHITEMSVKVAKSIGLLYKLNRFFLKLFLKRYILHLFIHILIIWDRGMTYIYEVIRLEGF